MKQDDDGYELLLRRRETEDVPLRIPAEALDSIRRVAASRDLSPEALLRLYVGQGLRRDLSREFGDRVLETAARVLTRHIESKEEISEIIREIQASAVVSA